MNNAPSQKMLNLSFLLPLTLGVMAFFAIVGPRALNPKNIAWLELGDLATHYLGWRFYRNASWEFPIGLNSTYGLELANSILFSDSNPLLAFMFKPLSSFLPETFQYFGVWLLLCFILQAWFGWKLVGLVSNSALLRFFGSGLFVFAPPMIWRLQAQHASLVGHFFIVAALYLAFLENLKRRKLVWGLLLAGSALVHAYLLAMVLAIWVADVGGRTIKNQITVRSAIFEFAALVGLIGFVCWQVGYFSVGSGIISGGFGFYRMNILSIFDSNGWSYVLRDLPEAQGDYEGFSYLGLGIIVLLAVSLPIVVARRREFFRAVVGYWYLLALFVMFALFAATNTFAIGTLEFEYFLPEAFLEKFNVFRASGRMFWPVFYGIIFASIVVVIKGLGRRTAIMVLGVALTVQVLDTSAGWWPLRKTFMIQPNTEWNSFFVDPFWSNAANVYQNVRYMPIENKSAKWREIAYYAGKHGLSTDAIYLARVATVSSENARRLAFEVLVDGKFEPDSLYILDDVSFRTALLNNNSDANVFARIDGFNVVAPGWKACTDCRVSIDETAVLPAVEGGELFGFGERIEFNVGGGGAFYLGYGWSHQETWGTWSDSLSSAMWIPITARKVDSLYIEAKVLVSGSHSTQRVEVLVNGVPSGSFTLKEPDVGFEVKIPGAAKLDSNAGMKIVFHFPDAARPKDVGLGNDGRTLAIGLKSLTLR